MAKAKKSQRSITDLSLGELQRELREAIADVGKDSPIAAIAATSAARADITRTLRLLYNSGAKNLNTSIDPRPMQLATFLIDGTITDELKAMHDQLRDWSADYAEEDKSREAVIADMVADLMYLVGAIIEVQRSRGEPVVPSCQQRTPKPPPV